MKPTALLLSLVAAAGVNAQDLFAGQPACATSCYSSAYTAAGCAVTDVACVCGPSATVIALNVDSCLADACFPNTEKIVAAQAAAAAVCEAAASARPTSAVASLTRPPTSTTMTSSASASSTSPPIDDEKGGSPSSSSSLSTGASIGVGVGIALGVVALVAVAWLLFKRRRSWKAKKSAGAGGQPEVLAFEVDGKDAKYRPELEANQVPVEIGGDHHGQRPPPPPPVELDGGGQRG